MMQNGYLELKISWQLFEKTPDTLTEDERGRLLSVAAKQQAIEQCILSSAEAANVIVVRRALSTRLEEIRKRYTSEDEFTRKGGQLSSDGQRRRRRNLLPPAPGSL